MTPAEARAETGQRWQRALVTGASSGIGREMARILASEGTELVVVARDADRLGALATELPVEVEVLPADLADPADLERVCARVVDDGAPIDLLVNNAGLGFTGEFVEVARDKKRLTVDVNVVAVLELCDAAARTMVRRGSGTILNVSSVAGDLPGPKAATYNATKAFVTSLSQSMSMELAAHGVVVSCLCPGLTRTEFQDRAEYDASSIPGLLWQSAEEVARAGLDGAARARAVVVPGVVNKTASRLMRSAPRVMARWSASAFNTK